MEQHEYNEESIRSLDWQEHIRIRPGMYIGKLGDGSTSEDGIYILIKEVIDNCIDEYVMGFGKKINIDIEDNLVKIRDYGRGIPLGKMIDSVSKINTGAKYDSKAFKKSVGLNGVGTKAVNALSSYFKISAIRENKIKTAEFQKGLITIDYDIIDTNEKNGTYVEFIADEEIFRNYKFKYHYIEKLLWNYCYLNPGLAIYFNGEKYISQKGLLDLLEANLDKEPKYPIIHLKSEDIEVAITHVNSSSEDYYTFVNGQNTTQGGTHLLAFKAHYVKIIRDFYKKNYLPNDIRSGLVAAVSIKIIEPVFESQTKTKLGSTEIEPNGMSINVFISDFLKNNLENFLYKNTTTSEILEKQIKIAERNRKDLEGIRKLAKDRAKKVSLHNKKLRDCKIHFTNKKQEDYINTTLFITEGDSASGSITKSRNVKTQAVFSLRGKPLNCFGLTKKIVYENEEFNLIQAALDIEDGLENLRYNHIVIATDADIDGMHIRLLLMTFFLQFFPELVKHGHLYILQTPLFRVRNKKETIYCYDEKEKKIAMNKLGANPEITRFKGLGEISPDEFKNFIGENIRLEPVIFSEDRKIDDLLEYYMGKNTNERQNFIIDNLRIEEKII